MKKCVLCNQSFEGYGNNPEPLSDKGRCCNICNDTKVIPARLNQFKNHQFKANITILREDYREITVVRENYKALLKRLLFLDNDEKNQQFYNRELQRIK